MSALDAFSTFAFDAAPAAPGEDFTSPFFRPLARDHDRRSLFNAAKARRPSLRKLQNPWLTAYELALFSAGLLAILLTAN